jgi:two-component system, sensor histidine kinase
MYQGRRARLERAGDERLTEGLRARIVLVALTSTVVALLLTFSIYQWSNWTADRRAMAAHQMAAGRIVAAVAQRALAENDPDDRAAADALLQADEAAVSAVYFAEDGRILRLGWPDAALRPRGVAVPAFRFGAGDLQVHIPHYEDGARRGELAVRASTVGMLQGRLRNIAVALALSLLATLAAAALAARLAGRALRPLETLNQGVEAVTATHDFSRRVEVRGDDEVARLTRNFNQLLGALQIYDASMRDMLAEVTEARDAAQDASRLKSQFLANMSHEVRTPLNGILGMAQALLRERLPRGQRERIEVIERSGQALLCVLNDVLDLGEIESGRLRIEVAPFDLEALVREAGAVAATLAESKGVAFAVDIAPEALGGWAGDAVRLRQLLYNLISNGLKFTPQGEVRVRVAPLADREGLSFTVSDTGIGIAAEALPRLFGKFVQGEAGATRRFGGAGLGLAICRRLVDLMGGDIAVESAPGQGSSFRVDLPLARAELAPDASREADPAPLRVLVAEDNATNQQVVRTVLNALGVDPVIVADGRAAVEAWRGGAFDLVLMDIQMPVRDGLTATRDIRRIEEEEGLAPTRIVALTANAMQHQLEEYAAAGMDGLVPKPIMVDRLQAALAGGAPLYPA